MAPTRFERAGRRNRFTARRATVRAISRPAEGVIRVTLEGPDFADFTSTGPADHVRLFFPDDATGELLAPVPADGGDGIVRPDGATINRDYTPLNPQLAAGGGSIDVDFMDHDSPGPATRWALAAAPGDEIVVVGPRGSKSAPTDLDALLLIVDETALPSATRWLADIPTGIPATVLVSTPRDPDWVRGYLGDRAAAVHVVDPGTALVDAVAALGPVGPGTFVFAAGEAGELAAVRRHLFGERGLPSEQVAISGYWKRGDVGFDHHTPLAE
jgi:NADPH-dependent ferric siderophore reductase